MFHNIRCCATSLVRNVLMILNVQEGPLKSYSHAISLLFTLVLYTLKIRALILSYLLVTIDIFSAFANRFQLSSFGSPHPYERLKKSITKKGPFEILAAMLVLLLRLSTKTPEIQILNLETSSKLNSYGLCRNGSITNS